jgi:hypothetical protein
MAKESLQEFFRAKKAKAEPGGIDWEARKTAWVRVIEDLYRQIVDEYLAEPRKSGLVKVEYSDKTMAENFLGEYMVRELVLQVGDEKAVFSPKGRNIVGAAGRVDLRGDMGEVTLVLQPEDRWCIVASRTPTLKLIPLNEESLLSALKRVMRQ